MHYDLAHQNPETLAEQERCHGHAFTDDEGIEYVYELRTHRAVYPYPHTSMTIYGEPTARGREHPKYIRCRRELRDDWSLCLHDSPQAEWDARQQILARLDAAAAPSSAPCDETAHFRCES